MAHKSRATRYVEIKESVSNSLSSAEDLKQELESWLENIPDNLQNSEKAEQLQSAIDELDNFINTLSEAVEIEVEFPTMF